MFLRAGSFAPRLLDYASPFDVAEMEQRYPDMTVARQRKKKPSDEIPVMLTPDQISKLEEFANVRLDYGDLIPYLRLKRFLDRTRSGYKLCRREDLHYVTRALKHIGSPKRAEKLIEEAAK